jgi:hypothetical protein
MVDSLRMLLEYRRNVMATTSSELRADSVLPVHSRVSWGGIVAGLFVTAAIFIILMALGSAIGLSVLAGGPDRQSFDIGAAVYTFVISLIALFVGGWVATQFTVGEGKFEAAIHGVVLWGLFMSLTIVFGLQMGAMGLQGLASNPHATSQIQQMAPGVLGNPPNPNAPDQPAPQTQEAAQKSYPAAWGTFGALLISMLVTVGGALAGSGPTLVLRRVGVVQPATPYTPPPPPTPR